MRLRELFAYDSATGVLTRIITTSNRCPAGARAGTLDRSTGYRKVNVDGRMYGEHVVIWCLVSGRWPMGLIDHRDGVRDRNVLENLRDGSRRLNQQNTRRARSDSLSGLQGVHPAKNGRCYSKIRTADGKVKHLGTFDRPEQANAAYLAAKRELHEGCTV